MKRTDLVVGTHYAVRRMKKGNALRVRLDGFNNTPPKYEPWLCAKTTRILRDGAEGISEVTDTRHIVSTWEAHVAAQERLLQDRDYDLAARLREVLGLSGIGIIDGGKSNARFTLTRKQAETLIERDDPAPSVRVVLEETAVDEAADFIARTASGRIIDLKMPPHIIRRPKT